MTTSVSRGSSCSAAGTSHPTRRAAGEALDALDGRRYGLVLSDHRLGGALDGLSLLREIGRRHPRRAGGDGARHGRAGSIAGDGGRAARRSRAHEACVGGGAARAARTGRPGALGTGVAEGSRARSAVPSGGRRRRASGTVIRIDRPLGHRGAPLEAAARRRRIGGAGLLAGAVAYLTKRSDAMTAPALRQVPRHAPRALNRWENGNSAAPGRAARGWGTGGPHEVTTILGGLFEALADRPCFSCRALSRRGSCWSTSLSWRLRS